MDLRSEAGCEACAAFLAGLEAAAEALGLAATDRRYRQAFSANYQALFPDNKRRYRVDVLEAACDRDAAIWVNGDKFEFSAEATGHAARLQQAWQALGTLLERWGRGGEKPLRPAAVAALADVDAAWADFERHYIAELIAIEAKARRLLVQAVEQERRLALLELSLGGRAAWQLPEYRAEQQRLCACVARLNAVAGRKGRGDLGVEVLEAAAAAGGGAVASDVLAAYGAVRGYLQKVGRVLERVDPHLCKNAGLVARLADWEESWELGRRYLLPPGVLAGLNEAVRELEAAQQLAPGLVAMREDCDVGLFLALPRLLLLCYLAEPAGGRAALARLLLPDRFSPEGEPLTELLELSQHFGEAQRALAPAAAWGGLVRRAVAGEAGVAEGEPAEVARLMRSVEALSLELQRRCPEDWNQLSAVLVQCLAGGRHAAARQEKLFQV